MKKSILIFYSVFIVCSSLSLVYIPHVFSYRYASEISIILILFPLFVTLQREFGIYKTIIHIVVLSSISLFIEYRGLITGMPYGFFSYNTAIPNQIQHILPWTVGLSYIPLLYGAVGSAYYFSKKPFQVLLLSVTFLLIIDIVIDPAAVSIGMWTYATHGWYYGVPFQNFIGWIVSSTITSSILVLLMRSYPKDHTIALTSSMYISLALWVYIALIKNLWIPACIGIAVLGYLLMIYSRNERNTQTK